MPASEKAYAVIEKECLALVWGIQKFHRYIYGAAFTVETDHQPLSFLNKAKLSNPRLIRGGGGGGFDFTTIWVPYCRENIGTDYLSRA